MVNNAIITRLLDPNQDSKTANNKHTLPRDWIALLEPEALSSAEVPMEVLQQLWGVWDPSSTYYKDYNIYKEEARHWEKYNDLKVKLRERIQSTVAPQKKVTLCSIYSVRKWLTDLKASTAMPLAKWEEIISQSIRYDEPLRTWLRDVCLVWERVPELSNYFSTVQTRIDELNTDTYTPASISAMIQRRWEHKKQGSMLRVAKKPRATRSAFSTQAVPRNGEEAPDASATPDASEAGATKQPKGSTKRKNKQRKIQSNNRGRRTDSNEESSNQSSNCSRSQNLGQQTIENANHALPAAAFKNNMKAASFKKTVDDYRKALQIAQSAADE
ncbi:hypothetical protein MMC22_006547 [Lobaria immixta]|nr:hypothetical protein [Lobaria immixta]